MSTVLRRFIVVLTILLLLSVRAQTANPPNYPTKPIELKYYAPGPWAVVIKKGAACCDSTGKKFDLYYPKHLGANGFQHPVLTWGNGSFAKPSRYKYFLAHMASWGFVVIATEDENTGPGQTVLDGAIYLINANSTPASVFYHKLNIVQIGAFGHSQGATGAFNAMLKSGGKIKTVVPIELPAQFLCTNPANCADTTKMSSGSIFLIDGSADLIISPPTQFPWETGEQSVAAYYDGVPAGVLKVKGTLIGPNHNDIQGQPSCQPISWPCTNGVYGYLGYPTAWMMAQLQGDNYARGAFVNGSGEIFSETTNWELAASDVP
jgi:hypothetical protein